MTYKHGASRYNNLACRCEICTSAQRERQAAFRLRRKDMPIPDHVHGTNNGYTNYSCRCAACRKANTEQQASWLERKCGNHG